MAARSYRVHTQAYSGPFDLLLTLVSRQKVAIGSISVSEVADQYLAEVERMGELDLDVASDFLLVASTLLDMKAASLVPDDPQERPQDGPDDEDEDDLADLTPEQARDVLVQRLITYKQFRNAAVALAARAEAEARMVPRTVGPDPEFQGLMPDFLEGVTTEDLASLCARLDAERGRFLLDAEHVAPRREPIALTVAKLDRITRSRALLTFSEALAGDTRPQTVVAMFLAVLELFKRGSIRVSQAENFGEMDIARVEGAPPFVADDAPLTSTGEDG